MRIHEEAWLSQLPLRSPLTFPDLKEAFSQGDDPYEAEQTAPPGLLELLATLGLSYPQNGNQWPSEASIPGFRKIIHEYSDAVLDFSKKLMRLIALSLDLEENYFDHMADFPMSSIRALHYPSQEVAGDIGIGAHADYSWFTLVNQLSPTPALEVLNHNGQWISAPPIRNTLVCNVGDFLEMATNNTFVSTVHRVVNKTGEERYSIPYFFSPSKDVMIETVPTCLKEGEDGMVPVRAGKWNWERLMRARYKHPAVIAARANGEL